MGGCCGGLWELECVCLGCIDLGGEGFDRFPFQSRRRCRAPPLRSLGSRALMLPTAPSQ